MPSARRQQSRLLASLLIALIVLTLVLFVVPGLLTTVLSLQRAPTFYVTLGFSALCVVAYLLNRAGHYRWAAGIAVTALSAGILATTVIGFLGINPYYEPDDVNLLIVLVIPVLFSSMLLSIPATALVVALNAAAMLLLTLPFPQVTAAMVASGPLMFFLVFSSLILLAARHRNRLELARRARLAQSERRFRMAVLNAPFPIMLHAEDGEIVALNQVWTEITGYTREEIPTIAAWTERAYGERSEAVREGIQDLFEKEGRITEGEFTITTREGESRIWHFSSALLGELPDGRRLALSMAADVTEREAMEQQLRQQERLAAVGQLAAGIAHDFRNLLSTIILYAQMSLLNHDLPLGATQNLRTIVDESHRATKLVQQILDFSSRAMIKPQALDLTALVRQVHNMLERTLPEHIHVRLDVEEAEPGAYTIKADPGRIQQALTNLALNARDAMPQGGTLRISLSRIESESGERPPVADIETRSAIYLAVSDTGTGMTKEVQEHLFEPFFTTKEVGKGSGLGLAQVYGIVRQHQGHIDVETAPGEGTTVRIYLPTHEEPAADVEGEGPATPPPGHGETILLVEDEKNLRKAGRGMLEALGYRVMVAATGREALAKYQSPRWSEGASQQVDLVITDLVMPEMGGEELLRELHKLTPHLPVVAITGYALQSADVEALRRAGFVDVLFKPLGIEALAREIRRILDRETG